MNAAPRAAVLPAAAILCAVFGASPLHTPLNNPNEGVRVFAAKALVEQHTFAINAVVKSWGYIDDKAIRDGQLYSSKAPLVQMLAALGYALIHPFTGDLSRPALTRVCRFFGDALPTLLAAVLLWRTLRRRLHHAAVADVTLAVLFTGTGALAYLNVLSGHALAEVAVAGALASAALDDGSPVAHRWIGLLLAAAVGAEYPAVLAAVPIGALALWRAPHRGSALLQLLAGALPVIALVCVAQTVMFGAPWRTGYSFLENAEYGALVQGTLFGIGAPVGGRIQATTVSPQLGLFFFSPVLLLGAAGCIPLWRDRARGQRPLVVAVVSITALMLAFIGGFSGWHGGWCVGPRYISELAGALIVPLALLADHALMRGQRAAIAVVAAAAAVGVVHAGLAGAFFPHLPDVFADPVRRLVLPLIAAGFAPDTPLLALGAGPRIASLGVVVAVAAPLALALWRLPGPLRGAAFAGAALATLVAVARPPIVGNATAEALEARRMFDNWRPEAGNPIVVSAAQPDDPHMLFAVDRGRDAFAPLRAHGCQANAGPVRAPAALLPAVAAADPHRLLIVSDGHADVLKDVHGGPVIAVARDWERFGKRAGGAPLVPCGDAITLLLEPGEQRGRGLAGLKERQRTALSDGRTLVELVEGFPAPAR